MVPPTLVPPKLAPTNQFACAPVLPVCVFILSSKGGAQCDSSALKHPPADVSGFHCPTPRRIRLLTNASIAHGAAEQVVGLSRFVGMRFTSSQNNGHAPLPKKKRCDDCPTCGEVTRQKAANEGAHGVSLIGCFFQDQRARGAFALRSAATATLRACSVLLHAPCL